MSHQQFTTGECVNNCILENKVINYRTGLKTKNGEERRNARLQQR